MAPLKKSVWLVFLLLTSYGYSQSGKIIARIHITGNRKTKESVILRELTFKPGDTIAGAKLAEELSRSKSNLVNTLLFNFVSVEAVPVDSVFTDVILSVTERIYLIPSPIFQFADPNFNTWWINKDFSRTNYGIYVLKRNFRGRNEDIAAIVQLGYSKDIGFLYKLPYITKKQNFGLGIRLGYKQNNEVTVGTENNERIFYTGSTGNSRDEYTIKLQSTLRRKLYSTHYLEVKYNSNHISDTITRMQGDYFYKNASQMKYPGLTYVFRHDTRDNKGYPLNGGFTFFEFNKYGTSFSGKNFNVITASLAQSLYFDLSERYFFATHIKVKSTLSKNIPYYFQEGLGYSSFVRGYEYYVVDGQHYALFKSNLKYCLVKPRHYEPHILRNTHFSKIHFAFYLNLYLDAGYVYDEFYAAKNPLSNDLLYGSGIGLDFVTLYDKVIRFEYSLNRELEHGFFLHFIKPV